MKPDRDGYNPVEASIEVGLGISSLGSKGQGRGASGSVTAGGALIKVALETSSLGSEGQGRGI